MERISLHKLGQVIDYLEQLHDLRRTEYGNIRHKLIDSIVIACTATLCGYKDYEEMDEWGKLKLDCFKGFLELVHGIPDESAGVALLKPGGSAGGAGTLACGRNDTGERVSSAWVGEHGLTLGPLTTEEKINEIRAVPKLLDLLDVQGAVVTADVMSCQKELAKKLQEKEAGYVLAVQENQTKLYGDNKDYFEGMESGELEELPEDIWQGEEEQGHGCVERWEIRTVTGREWLESREAWQDVKTIVHYRTFRMHKGKETVQRDR
jgi:predicted transposase YbfD/YdcC